MMRSLALALVPPLLFALSAPPALAESLVAMRTLPARTLITAADLALVDADIPGALGAMADAVGLETRRAIYAGRPVRPEDVGPPALVDRNAIVTLRYQAGSLTIVAEGRALGRGGAGDRVRVLNLSSKTTVEGLIAPDGTILVGENR